MSLNATTVDPSSLTKIDSLSPGRLLWNSEDHDSHSPYKETAVVKTTPSLEATKPVQWRPTAGVLGFNQTIRFQTAKYGHLLGPIKLHFLLSAITPNVAYAGLGGSTAWGDGLGYRLIREMRIRQDERIIFTKQCEDFMRDHETMSKDIRPQRDNEIFFMKTFAEGVAAAGAALQVTVTLDGNHLPWTANRGCWLNLNTLDSNLVFEFDISPIYDCVNYDLVGHSDKTPAAFGITDMWMEPHFSFLETAERAKKNARPFSSTGHDRYFCDYVKTYETWNAGTGDVRDYKLEAFKASQQSTEFMIHKATDHWIAGTPYYKDPFVGVAWTSWQFIVNSHSPDLPITYADQQRLWSDHFPHAYAGSRRGRRAWCLVPAETMHKTGTKDLSVGDDPKFSISMAGQLIDGAAHNGVDKIVTLSCQRHNIIKQEGKVLKRYF